MPRIRNRSACRPVVCPFTFRKDGFTVKKLIGLLLSAAMVVTLTLGTVGCGKDKDKKDKKDADSTKKADADKKEEKKADADKKEEKKAD